MARYDISARYVDTCLPCYLTDHYNREGQTLLLATPSGQSPEEAVDELFESLDCDCGLPESVTDEQIKAALLEAVREIDWRRIGPNGERLDAEPEESEDESGDTAYVYVVLEWEKHVHRIDWDSVRCIGGLVQVNCLDCHDEGDFRVGEVEALVQWDEPPGDSEPISGPGGTGRTDMPAGMRGED